MNEPVRLLVHGAGGRMGQALLRLCAEPGTGCEVVAAVSRRVGQRVVDGVPQFAASELHGVPTFDVAVDFSLPEGFDAILALCLERGSGRSMPDPVYRSSAAPRHRAQVPRATHLRRCSFPRL